MNKRLGFLTVLSIVVVASFALVFASALRPNGVAQASSVSAQATTTDNSGIMVSGEGKVSVKPDLAIATIGVETMSATLSDATSQSNTKISAVISKLKSLAIDEKDIQTTNYNVSPITQPSPKAPEGSSPAITGYRVSNQVSVTVRKLSDLGTVLDAVVGAGANTIYGVSFGVADSNSMEQQARTLAIKDAQAKAAQLAKDSGVTLGPIVSITEGGGVTPLASPMAARGLAASAVPVETGQLQVIATLSVRFAIR